jgi:hypothetical protein
MSKRIQNIQKVICELENIYPDDNIIRGYKDFLKHRDYLRYYKFNTKVFISLIDLTYRLWETEERISRASLIQELKRYFLLCKDPKQLPIGVSNQLFYIFKQVHYYKKLSLNKNTLSELNSAMNYLIRDNKYSSENQKWLCKNADYSTYTINRLLRYKYKSSIISSWARYYYNTDEYRHRRAEIASWIIDEDVSFEISKDVIIQDFEYIFDESKDYRTSNYDYTKLLKNSFGISYQLLQQYSEGDMISEDIRNEFYSNINLIQQKTNMWAVSYSRLNSVEKASLLKKKYVEELESSFVYICKKNGLVKTLKWLKKI